MRMRFSTHDPEIMAANVAAISGGATIVKLGAGQFFADVDVVRIGALGLMRISTRNIRVRTESGAGFTSLTIPLREGFEIDRNRRCEHFDKCSAHLQNLDEPFDFTSKNTSVLVANCSNAILMKRAAKLNCGEQALPPDLNKKISLSSQSGARLWRAACSLWLRAGKEHCSRASALAIAEGEKGFEAAVLRAAGLDAGLPLSSSAGQQALRAVKRTEDWIVANLEQPISRADLCEISGLQVRALTRAFSRFHAQGPMQFVRQRRLDAVQRTLLGAEPDETTVTRVATDFGFYHLGRFAADYCDIFGEHPSETLCHK
jgi:AraC family ethanolamine operon transcriptional activator